MPGGQVVPDRDSLEQLLREFRELPPKTRTPIRRDLRRVGDDVIERQRAILSGPLPPGVQVAGKTLKLVRGRGGKVSLRKVNRYQDAAVKRPGRSTGLREGIKNALVMRVVTGQTRQGLDFRTQNNKAPMSTGWNAKRFRHPVFGNRDAWVYQAGQPYFFAPVIEGRNDVIRRATDILNNALEGR